MKKILFGIIIMFSCLTLGISLCDSPYSIIFIEPHSEYDYSPYIDINEKYVNSDETPLLSDNTDALEIAMKYIGILKKQQHIREDYYIRKVFYDDDRHIWFFQVKSELDSSIGLDYGDYGPNYLIAISQQDGRLIGIYFN